MILCYNINKKYQFGYYNMYSNNFSEAKFIDTYPSFNIKEGRGRIIMVQWNYFLRKIKKYIYRKKRKKLIKMLLFKTNLLPEHIIYISKFI